MTIRRDNNILFIDMWNNKIRNEEYFTNGKKLLH